MDARRIFFTIHERGDIMNAVFPIAVCFILLAGCTQRVEHVIRFEETPASAAEQEAMARLKQLNDLNGPATAAYGKLQDEKSKLSGDGSLVAAEASLAFMDEHERLLKADPSHAGQLKAAQFFHDELVGKTLDQFVSKWSKQ